MIRRLNFNSGIARNVLTLFAGSTLAQAIPLLVSPVLTRLYPVHDFAVLTVMATLVSFAGVIAAGRYEIAIGLPASDDEAKKVVYLAMGITSVFSVLLMVFFIFGGTFVAASLNAPDATHYLLLVPMAILFYGWYQALTYWNIRKRRYTVIASSRVSQSLINSGVSLLFAFTGIPVNGLVLGHVSGHFAATAWTWIRMAGRREIDFRKTDMTRAGLRQLAAKYSDLPKVNGIHALSDMAQTSLVVFIISGMFGSIATGLYGLTMRILQAPLNVIGSSFTAVFYKEVSEKINRQERISKLLRTTMGTLAMISFPVFLVLFIAGPALFSFVFGEQWREAGVYARIMCPWLFLNFIASPVSHLPVILSRQRQFFLFSLAGNLSVITGLMAGAFLLDGIRQTLMAVCAVQVVFQSCMIAYFIHIARQAENSFFTRN
jgi:O-antigen/teichoic acid export membrane protein